MTQGFVFEFVFFEKEPHLESGNTYNTMRKGEIYKKMETTKFSFLRFLCFIFQGAAANPGIAVCGVRRQTTDPQTSHVGRYLPLSRWASDTCSWSPQVLGPQCRRRCHGRQRRCNDRGAWLLRQEGNWRRTATASVTDSERRSSPNGSSSSSIWFLLHRVNGPSFSGDKLRVVLVPAGAMGAAWTSSNGNSFTRRR